MFDFITQVIINAVLVLAWKFFGFEVTAIICLRNYC